MTHPLRRAVCAALVLLAAAGCTQTASAPPAAAVAAASPVVGLPEAGGCAGEIARTRAVLDSDIATGNLNKAVGARFSAEIDRAAATCSAGRDGEALRMVAATKTRFGYR